MKRQHLSLGACMLLLGRPKPNIVIVMPRYFCMKAAAGMEPPTLQGGRVGVTKHLIGFGLLWEHQRTEQDVPCWRQGEGELWEKGCSLYSKYLAHTQD